MFDHLAQGGELGVTGSIHLRRRRMQGRQAIAIFDQVLFPADEVHVLQQHLHLAPDEQTLKRGVFNIHVLDVDLLQLLGVALDAGQRCLYVAQLTLYREGERRHRAFHALEHVDAQQVDQAFLAVGLPEEAFATANLGAVLLVVSGLLVRQHVPERRVGGEVQTADLVVDLADRAEFAGAVHIGLDVDRFQPVGEAAGLGGAVVFLDVLARARDGEQVEQSEVIEAEHLDQP